jgi:hypothetical protein
MNCSEVLSSHGLYGLFVSKDLEYPWRNNDSSAGYGQGAVVEELRINEKSRRKFIFRGSCKRVDACARF